MFYMETQASGILFMNSSNSRKHIHLIDCDTTHTWHKVVSRRLYASIIRLYSCHAAYDKIVTAVNWGIESPVNLF